MPVDAESQSGLHSLFKKYHGLHETALLMATTNLALPPESALAKRWKAVTADRPLRVECGPSSPRRVIRSSSGASADAGEVVGWITHVVGLLGS